MEAVGHGENDIEDLLNDSDDEDGEDDDRIDRGRRRRRRMSIPAEMQLPEGSTKYTRRGRGVKKPGEVFQELLAYLLNLLVKKDTNKWFSVPMNDRIAPGYSKTVAEPMDFTTMENNLDTQGYTTLKEMKYDFELICKNAMAFNKPDTRYYKAAKRLRAYGLQMLSKKNLRDLVKERPVFSGLTRFELGFELDDIGDTDEEETGLLFDDDSRPQSDSATESGPSQTEENVETVRTPDLKDVTIKQVSVRLKRGRKRKESPAKLDDNLKAKSEPKSGNNTPERTSNMRNSRTKQTPELKLDAKSSQTKIPPELTYCAQICGNGESTKSLSNGLNPGSTQMFEPTYNQHYGNTQTFSVKNTGNKYLPQPTPNYENNRISEKMLILQNSFNSVNKPTIENLMENKAKPESKADSPMSGIVKIPGTPPNVLEQILTSIISEEDDKISDYQIKVPEVSRDNFASNNPSDNGKEEIIDTSEDIGKTVDEPNDSVSDYYFAEETYTHKKFGQRNYFKHKLKPVKM